MCVHVCVYMYVCVCDAHCSCVYADYTSMIYYVVYTVQYEQ